MAVLRAEGLRKSYNQKEVVKGVKITLKSGEIVGLLGPNGAGKTTTFYMIVGNISSDDGNIYLDEVEITNMPMYQRGLLGLSYLPQEPSVFRGLTVEENLKVVLEIKGLDNREIERRTERILKEFGIERLSGRTAETLSGGERRRTEIARAISLEPKFILLDEPFAGIDPIAIIDLKRMLQKLKDRGIGILITDHNVRDTLAITDRAYIINDGQILSEGYPQELVNDKLVKETYLGEDFRI